jgi:uncharacterized protein
MHRKPVLAAVPGAVVGGARLDPMSAMGMLLTVMVASAPKSKGRDLLSALRGEFPRFGVRHVWLFGSRSRGDDTSASDWDVLVEFSGQPSFDAFMGLKCFLEDHLGGRVDLLSRKACSPRFLAAIQDDLDHVA